MGNSALGGRYWVNAASFAPWGASWGAKIAVAIKARTIKPPMAPSGWRPANQPRACRTPCAPPTRAGAIPASRAIPTASSTRFAISGVPNPRVEPAVHKVHKKVNRQVDKRHHEDDRLHGGIVAVADRLDQRGAHAGDRKDDLHDHDPAQEPAAPPADERDHRQERVAEGVAVDHRPLRQALGPRGPDVVVADDLQHLGAGESRDGGADVVGLSQRRPDKLLEILRGTVHERHELERREISEEPDEAVEEEHPGEKDRQGEPADAYHTHQVVRPGVLADRGNDPERDRPDKGDDDRQEREFHGAGEALLEDVRHGPALRVGVAEVPSEGVAQPGEVLDDHGPVEAELVADLLDLLLLDGTRLGPGLIDEDLRDVAWHQPHQDEDQDRGSEEGGNEQEQATRYVLTHPDASGVRRRGAADRRTGRRATLHLFRVSPVQDVLGRMTSPARMVPSFRIRARRPPRLTSPPMTPR